MWASALLQFLPTTCHHSSPHEMGTDLLASPHPVLAQLSTPQLRGLAVQASQPLQPSLLQNLGQLWQRWAAIPRLAITCQAQPPAHHLHPSGHCTPMLETLTLGFTCCTSLSSFRSFNGTNYFLNRPPNSQRNRKDKSQQRRL